MGILLLWVGAAGGQPERQEFEGVRPTLQAGMEVSFFAYSPPELSLHAQVQRKDWQMGVQLTHPLDLESSSPTLTLTERLQMGAGVVQLTLSNNKESGALLDVLVQGQTSYGQASVQLQISSSGMSGTMNGSLSWNGLKANIEQLRYAEGSLREKKATLNWIPLPELSIALSVDEKSGLGPLEVKFQRGLEESLKLELTGRFTVGDQRLEPWEWEASLGREKDVGAGLRLDARGEWQQLWLQATRSWGPASLRGTLYVGLEGFQAFQLKGGLARWPTEGLESTGTLEIKSEGWTLALKPRLTFGLDSSLEAEVKMDSASSWGTHLKGQWIELFGSAQGEFTWEPKGLSDLQLHASLLLDSLGLQGDFICRGICDGQSWTATLLGNISLEMWELSGQLGLAPSGWDSITVDVTRLFSLGK